MDEARASWLGWLALLSVAALALAQQGPAGTASEPQRALVRVRARPADQILLEDGSLQRTSSLEEFLERSSTDQPSSRSGRLEADTLRPDPASQSNQTAPLAGGVRQHQAEPVRPGQRHQPHQQHQHQQQQPKLHPEQANQTAQASTFPASGLAARKVQQPAKDLPGAAGSNGAEEAQPAQPAQPEKSGSHVNESASGVISSAGSGGANGLQRINKSHIPQHWEVTGLLNVSQDYPLMHSRLIYGYAWPLVAAITMFSNLMIVIVLTQHDMRTPTNVVLTAIAIADIIPIVVPVPWFVYLFALENEDQVLFPATACYIYHNSTRWLSELFYFLSTWLNVLLAVQDYLSACQPRLAERWCRLQVVWTEIILLTLLAFLLNLPQALKLVFQPVTFYYKGRVTWGCRKRQARWFRDLFGSNPRQAAKVYDDVFTAITIILVDGGPSVALIVLTALLIRQLKRQKIKGLMLMEQARTASKRRRERYRQQELESSARVMIFVLLAFLAVKLPFATTEMLMLIQSHYQVTIMKEMVDFQLWLSITDLIFVLSYPINFTIFCCWSKKFRHKCAQLLAECTGRQVLTSPRQDLHRASLDSEVSQGSHLCAAEAARSGAPRAKRSEPPLHLSQYAGQVHLAQAALLAQQVPLAHLEQPHQDQQVRAIPWRRQLDAAEPVAASGGRGRSCTPPPLGPLRISSPIVQQQLPQILVSGRCDCIQEQQERGRAGLGGGSQAAGRRQRPRQMGANRGSSEPCFLSIRQLICFATEAGSCAGSQENSNASLQAFSGAGQQQQHWLGVDGPAAGDRQRSLSLSHSRLATLPSSTALLADVLLATLMPSSLPAAAASGGSAAARSAVSEPPIHLPAIWPREPRQNEGPQ